jgi:hypothetical protein
MRHVCAPRGNLACPLPTVRVTSPCTPLLHAPPCHAIVTARVAAPCTPPPHVPPRRALVTVSVASLCTRALHSSRRTTSGSRNPPADAVDDIEDVADRGVHAVLPPASSGPPRRWVLIMRPCSWSGFVRASAAATPGGPPRLPAALGLPTFVYAWGRERGRERQRRL